MASYFWFGWLDFVGLALSFYAVWLWLGGDSDADGFEAGLV
jgi:hypothetical protein